MKSLLGLITYLAMKTYGGVEDLRIRNIGSPTPRSFTRRKYSRRRFDRKLSGPDCRCGCYGTRNISCAVRESNTASSVVQLYVSQSWWTVRFFLYYACCLCPWPNIPLTKWRRMRLTETFTCGVEERCIQSFGGETRRKDTTLRTLT